jgi:hypothetical protein
MDGELYGATTTYTQQSSSVVTFDTSVRGQGTSFSYTTSSSANRIMLVPIYDVDGGDTCTGVTYNGTSLTLLKKNVFGSNKEMYLFYELNPSSGANTLAVSGCSAINVEVYTYSGVKQSTPGFSFTLSSTKTLNGTINASTSNAVVWATGGWNGTGSDTGVTYDTNLANDRNPNFQDNVCGGAGNAQADSGAVSAGNLTQQMTDVNSGTCTYGGTNTFTQVELDPFGGTAPPSTQNYAARFDNGGFNAYTYTTSASSSKWTVQDKFGNTYLFGSSTTERLVDPSNGDHVYRWMLGDRRQRQLYEIHVCD